MPEGPEVFITSEQINKRIKNKKLISITSFGYFKINDSQIRGNLAVVEAHGKTLWFRFSNDKYILVHAALDGKWLDNNDDADVEMNFDNTKIYFKEPMHIGQFKIVEYPINLVPDARMIDEEDFLKILDSKQKICNLLIDQHKIAGIGNYMRAEILYMAKIHPNRNNLTIDEKKRIFKSMKKLYTQVIKNNGSQYYSIFEIYGKYKMKIYKNLLADTIKISGRTVYYDKIRQK